MSNPLRSLVDQATRGYLLSTSSNPYAGVTATDYIPQRGGSSPQVPVVTADTALRHSAVWACLRLRANLVSATPVDVFRRVAGVQVEAPKPPLLVSPGGGLPAYQAGSTNQSLSEWLWATQFDRDRYGNAFGIITARDALGFPATVELVPTASVTMRGSGQRVSEVLVSGERYSPEQVWHERQYTVPGSPFGLSPIMYAAWSIATYLAAEQFGLDFFASPMPSGHLRNVDMDIVGEQVVEEAKRKFKAATANHDIFVTGRGWEWTPASVPDAAMAFIDKQKLSISDIARYLDVPGDMIDAESSSGSITYANVTQRNVQLLVMHMGPVFEAREEVFTSALPRPRFVKFNTDAILRMDPEARTRLLIEQANAGLRLPSEVRGLDNLAPYDEAGWSELERFRQVMKAAPTGGAAPAVGAGA